MKSLNINDGTLQTTVQMKKLKTYSSANVSKLTFTFNRKTRKVLTSKNRK